MKYNKYSNKPVVIDGIKFQSTKEGKRWGQLKLLERAGEIKGLERQVRFDFKIDDILVCFYKADFVYIKGKDVVVEDAKGFKTPMYRLKKKLMKAIYDIEIKEV